MGNECVPRLPPLQEAECLAEAHLRVVCVTERLVASADAQPLARLTLSGIGVHGSANVNDRRPHGSSRGNESERVKGVESGNDY